MKLIIITTKGLGEFPVIAESAQQAEDFVTAMLSQQDYGFSDDRKVISIEFTDEEPIESLRNKDWPFLSDKQKRLLIVANWPRVLKPVVQQNPNELLP